MKLCILLQRNFAYVGHQLAILLKENYGLDQFCGYVYLRSSFDFLKSQKDINYTNLILDEDIQKEYRKEKLDLQYLAYLEKEFGLPNLWPYITLDRILMYNQMVREYPYNTPRHTHEEMMRIFQVKAKAIIRFLEKERPDCILFPNIGGIGALLLWTIGKKMGIKTLDILLVGNQDRYTLSEKYDYFTGAEEILKNNKIPSQSKEKANVFLNNFRNKPRSEVEIILEAIQKINFWYPLKFLYPQNFWRSFTWFIKITLDYLKEKKLGDYSYIHPWDYLIDRIKRKVRNLIGAKDLYDPYTPEEDFAFFPLHLEPEISTLLQAPFYTDQINLIRQIARSLPIHYKLYVKEHPMMVEYRPRKFYKEIKKIPNVKLINPAIHGIEIVSKAKLITAITSTAGWEGVLLKKPVITFGKQFYNALSMVKKCSEIEKLPYLVKNQLENYRHNDEELINFIAAIFEDSVLLNLTYLWERETNQQKKKEGLRNLSDLLAKKLGLQRK